MKRILIFIIKCYQIVLSPIFPNSCRFSPTCSEYSIQAINKYGVVKGGFMAVKRIIRCNPFNSGGYDPVR